MITLHQFPPGPGLPVSFSPFCAKLEAYLRLAGRKYTTTNADPRTSPNKALPFVTFADGSVLGDSGAIIARLEAEGPALGDGDEPARELGRSAEDALYHACLYVRFVDPEGWREQKKNFDPLLPWYVRPLIVRLVRASQTKKAAANGFTGPADYPKAIDVVHRIAAALRDRPFLTGDRPAVPDCAVWGQLTAHAYTPSPNALRTAVRESAILTAYIDRFAARCEWTLSTQAP